MHPDAYQDAPAPPGHVRRPVFAPSVASVRPSFQDGTDVHRRTGFGLLGRRTGVQDTP